MPCRLQFSDKKNCGRLSSSEVQFYTENGRFAFLSPFGDLGAMYDDHFRLIGKRMDFLIVLIELFSLCVTALALYERISTENRRFLPNGVSLTHNFRWEESPPLIILLSQN